MVIDISKIALRRNWVRVAEGGIPLFGVVAFVTKTAALGYTADGFADQFTSLIDIFITIMSVLIVFLIARRMTRVLRESEWLVLVLFCGGTTGVLLPIAGFFFLENQDIDKNYVLSAGFSCAIALGVQQTAWAVMRLRRCVVPGVFARPTNLCGFRRWGSAGRITSGKRLRVIGLTVKVIGLRLVTAAVATILGGTIGPLAAFSISKPLTQKLRKRIYQAQLMRRRYEAMSARAIRRARRCSEC